MTLPCQPWTTADRLCCPDEASSLDCNGDPVVASYPWTDDELIRIASRLLFHATCERFPGECSGHEFRPCSCECRDISCCKCEVSSVPLAGRYPVLEIDEVRVDGAMLPSSAYRLDEFSRLVRVDGQRWPARQDLTADPNTDADTFIIRFSVGRAVPDDLQYAAALLACELKKACGGQGCALPDGVQRVVRDGIEFEVAAEATTFTRPGVVFGVPEIDRIVSLYQPCGARGPRQRLMFADDPGGVHG
jgi:hypothetical protein